MRVCIYRRVHWEPRASNSYRKLWLAMHQVKPPHVRQSNPQSNTEPLRGHMSSIAGFLRK
jgi:hypothetical protein